MDDDDALEFPCDVWAVFGVDFGVDFGADFTDGELLPEGAEPDRVAATAGAAETTFAAHHNITAPNTTPAPTTSTRPIRTVVTRIARRARMPGLQEERIADRLSRERNAPPAD